MPDLKKAIANSAKATAALMHEAAGSPPDREYANVWVGDDATALVKDDAYAKHFLGAEVTKKLMPPNPQQTLANDLRKRFLKHFKRNKN